MKNRNNPTVALFVTCLVDAFRPNIGFAAHKLLDSVGARVRVPTRQTCCGQPAFNNGDEKTARTIAKQVIETFAGFDRIVVPSASCGGMLQVHYPELLEDDPIWAPRARGFAARVRELSQFLEEADIKIDARYDGVAAYHDSCSSLREMKVQAGPRNLLSQVGGLEVRDLENAEICCGFGGTFCVKYSAISTRLVTDKVADVRATEADTLIAGDLGCLMNIAGRLTREGMDIRVFHYAEVVAGMTDVPGLGAAAET